MEIMHDQPEVTLSINIKFQTQAIESSIYSLMAKRNLSTKSHFLTHELSNFHHIYTVEYFLEVILSSYRFKKDNFHSENLISNLKHAYKVAAVVKESQIIAVTSDWLKDSVRPLPRYKNAEGY